MTKKKSRNTPHQKTGAATAGRRDRNNRNNNGNSRSGSTRSTQGNNQSSTKRSGQGTYGTSLSPTDTKHGAEIDIVVLIKDHNDSNGGHPHIIVDNVDNNHVSVGLSTQKKKGKGRNSGTNYSLDKSPFNDGRISYMRRQGTVAPINKYSNPRSGKMTPKDYTQAKVYGERAKQKYLSDKGNKKK